MNMIMIDVYNGMDKDVVWIKKKQNPQSTKRYNIKQIKIVFTPA